MCTCGLVVHSGELVTLQLLSPPQGSTDRAHVRTLFGSSVRARSLDVRWYIRVLFYVDVEEVSYVVYE
jgi:hypothetical protein